MKLSQYLTPATIEEGLKSTDKSHVLAELSELLQKAGAISADLGLRKILENREELGSTGIGDGVAIPHVRLHDLSEIKLAVGRSAEGIDFGSPDGLPVRLFFLLLAPEQPPGVHLKALAHISRLLKKKHLKGDLLNASGREEILAVIAREDSAE